jgi:hypothetical protein
MASNELLWLKDVEEIKQLKARYGALVDSCPERGLAAATELAQLFTSEMNLDFQSVFGKTFKSRDDVRQFFGEGLAASRGWMWHTFSNPIITVEGDRATGVWMLHAMSTPRDDPHSAPKVSYGRYYDDYVRSPGGWMQSALRFENLTRNYVPPSGIGA